jgi:hypothetical protein
MEDSLTDIEGAMDYWTELKKMPTKTQLYYFLQKEAPNNWKNDYFQ